MDKTLAFVQLAVAAVMFLLVLTGVVGHIALGHVISFPGYLACFASVCLSWTFVRISFKEFHENP